MEKVMLYLIEVCGNGITGYKESWDGNGIDFKEEDNGNEWRWTAQWIPHSAWFLQAVIAMTAE